MKITTDILFCLCQIRGFQFNDQDLNYPDKIFIFAILRLVDSIKSDEYREICLVPNVSEQ